ncbi:MAG: threonine--tRNA ligase, partial [Eubacteriales bacterium]
SGAYWKNDASGVMLTRISGTAFPTEQELKEWQRLQKEAVLRDHRTLGREMELFLLVDEGPGFPFFLPNGMTLKNELVSFWRRLHRENGYQEISTPQVLSRSLWEQSGHWAHYSENMYATEIDGDPYCLKPMNCPGGMLVYKSVPRSYRDLPLRLAELGLVHRHEMRGTLHGLFRVRCFTQDDAHIFMTREQIPDEIVRVIGLIDRVYRLFGFSYSVELSTRPENSMGSDEDWEAATEGLRTALERKGLAYTVNEGDGAFYGPKIDFHLRDALGRTWQCGTIQLDFQMPQKFSCTYIDADNKRVTPVMIHRTCFGSVERFLGILTEQYAGRFPTWLAPIQVKILTLPGCDDAYADEVSGCLQAAGIRCVTDSRDEKIGYKVREARQKDRVPYMLILGAKECAEHIVSVRSREDSTEGMTTEEFIRRLKEEIAAYR